MVETDGVPVRAILHVGAPKCGSSALQTALSAQPRLVDAAGRRHLYTAARQEATRLVPVHGRRLAAMARHSVHGYACWPNVARQDDPAAYWSAVGGALSGTVRRGAVPVLSSEGWIAHAAAATELVARAGLEVLDVAAYVRPPLEWLNASYWQWMIWTTGRLNGHQVERWAAQARFQPGLQLAAWATTPRVRLHVASARQDVVADFAARYRLPLQAVGKVNGTPPPALTGFFLRNRRFRPSGHDSAVEFVVQRWCRFPPGPRLWAFLPRFAAEAWPRLMEDTARMMEALPPETAERLLAEPGWTSLEPYRPQLNTGIPRLDEPEALAGLYDAVAEGTAEAERAVRRRPEAGVSKPAASAPVEVWDAAIAHHLDRLLEADRRWRRRGTLRRLIGLS